MTPQRIKRQILEAIAELQGEDESSAIADTQVADRTGIEVGTVGDYMELLVADGHIVDASDSMGHAAALTAQGRIALSITPQRSSPQDERMTHGEIRRLILQTIQDNQPNSGISVQDSVIAEKTGLSVQEVQDHLEVLGQEGKVTLAITTGGHGAWLTAHGRLGLQEQPEKGPAKSLERASTDTIQWLVLGAIAKGHDRNVRDSEIAEKTGLDLQLVRDHLDLLAEEDMLVATKTLDGSRHARLKPRGRITLETRPVITELPNSSFPIEIQESLARFRADHPDKGKVAFIMMKFGQTDLHEKVVKGIKSALEPHGITGLRADDKQYHDDLFDNMLTYIFGCGLGVAVFERIESDEFNPNVSLEVGYLMALRKPVCLLKDRTLMSLHSDLVGKLYKPFDPQNPIKSIPPVLRQWLADKGFA